MESPPKRSRPLRLRRLRRLRPAVSLPKSRGWRSCRGWAFWRGSLGRSVPLELGAGRRRFGRRGLGVGHGVAVRAIGGGVGDELAEQVVEVIGGRGDGATRAHGAREPFSEGVARARSGIAHDRFDQMRPWKRAPKCRRLLPWRWFGGPHESWTQDRTGLGKALQPLLFLSFRSTKMNERRRKIGKRHLGRVPHPGERPGVDDLSSVAESATNCQHFIEFLIRRARATDGDRSRRRLVLALRNIRRLTYCFDPRTNEQYLSVIGCRDARGVDIR